MEEEVKITEEIVEEPKTELTEEEAKIAAENVGKILEVLDKYKSLDQRRREKFERMKLEAESLPEGHYKKRQLAYKMLELSKKINPNVFWDSKEKGTYRKSEVKAEKADE